MKESVQGATKESIQEVAKESVDEKAEQRDSRITVSKTTSEIYVPVGCGKRTLRCEGKKKFRNRPNGKVAGLQNIWPMLSRLLQWYCGGSERVRTQNRGLCKHCKKLFHEAQIIIYLGDHPGSPLLYGVVARKELLRLLTVPRTKTSKRALIHSY